jgi:hypothetical protein
MAYALSAQQTLTIAVLHSSIVSRYNNVAIGHNAIDRSIELSFNLKPGLFVQADQQYC